MKQPRGCTHDVGLGTMALTALAVLLFAVALSGCTLVGASVTASGDGFEVDAEVAGVSTSVTLPIPLPDSITGTDPPEVIEVPPTD